MRDDGTCSLDEPTHRDRVVRGGQDESDADHIVTLPDLLNEGASRRVVQNDRGRVQVFGDIVERILQVDDAGGIDVLTAGNLPVKQLVTDRFGVTD